MFSPEAWTRFSSLRNRGRRQVHGVLIKFGSGGGSFAVESAKVWTCVYQKLYSFMSSMTFYFLLPTSNFLITVHQTTRIIILYHAKQYV